MQANPQELADGLLTLPYTTNDWIIIVLAICSYLFRMYLIYKNRQTKNPAFMDWIGILVLTILSTVCLYELAIYKEWPMRVFFFPFSISIIVSKDIADWLFMSRDGKAFVIATFKELISNIFKTFGYKKIDNNEENILPPN